MMKAGEGNRYHPFTARQWQELEQQALFYKYMISGMPIPPHLLFTITATLPPYPSNVVGWGSKIDPEPGRCRRTDGKKWRCSKQAYPDSKYCQRHMHRGRNRSRKPVETKSPNYPPHFYNHNKFTHVSSTPPNVLSSQHHLLLDSIPYRKSHGMKDESSKTSLDGVSWQLAINTSENGCSSQQQPDDPNESETEEKVMHHFLI